MNTSPQSPPTQSDKELRQILNTVRKNYGSNGISDEYEEELLAALHTHITRAKIEELTKLPVFYAESKTKIAIDNRIAELKGDME